MNSKLQTMNLRHKRFFVRFEAFYAAHTCILGYKRLRARDSAYESSRLDAKLHKDWS